jgi:DNA-binding transcriptional LysR family regulator
VARERSFTRAAAQLGVSQSALSQTVRGLEGRLGLRLLTRTTRSVAPTEAGERLLHAAGTRLDEIDGALTALSALRDKPARTIRITAHDHALRAVLWPALERLLTDYPDIKVEVVTDYGLTDIVAERFDAGVRVGEQVAHDMVAVRIGPHMRSAVVGTPAYFAGRQRPVVPQYLTTHRCINLRLPTRGGLYAWEFEKSGRALRVRVEGQLVFNGSGPMLDAALSGFGLAYPPEDTVRAHVADGRLVRALADWCPPYAGVPFVLSEPAAANTGVRFARECVAVPGLWKRPGLRKRMRWWGGREGRAESLGSRIAFRFLPRTPPPNPLPHGEGEKRSYVQNAATAQPAPLARTSWQNWLASASVAKSPVRTRHRVWPSCSTLLNTG